MPKPVRIQEVAKAAGVSTATVSRALSQPERLSKDTLELVEKAVISLGYVPNAAGRALALGRTRTVGCVVPTLDHAIFARSTHALQNILARAGYQLLVASHNYDPISEVAVVRALIERGVDALVLVGAEHDEGLWQALRQWSRPTLLTWACDPRLPSVGFDNQDIAAMATRHLLDLGHRDIGMISGLTTQNDRARARLDGLRACLASMDLRLRPEWFTTQSLTLEGGRLGLQALLKQSKRPSGIVCGNDLLAVGALLEAQRQGISVPAELSIIGIDNHELAAEVNPGLTTVSLPTQQLGQITANQVLAALAGEPIAQQSLLPFELLVRGTTAAPARKKDLRTSPPARRASDD